MFTVEHHRNGYKIGLGDGKRGGHFAENMVQVEMALEHYFRPQHIYHNPHTIECPLCRAQEELKP